MTMSLPINDENENSIECEMCHKSSLKSASHVGCRILLWLLVVIPSLLVTARTEDEVANTILVPRVLFMVGVALLTIRHMGRYFQAGNILYVCFETAVVVSICYVALAVIWANMEGIVHLLLITFSHLLEIIWGAGLSKRTIETFQFVVTMLLATAFLMWAFFTVIDLNGPEYSVRFSSVVEVRFILPRSHHPESPTTEMIKAPEGAGRNPVVYPSTTTVCSPEINTSNSTLASEDSPDSQRDVTGHSSVSTQTIGASSSTS